MATRPNYREHGHSSPPRAPSGGRLPSPRVEHFDGEIPPALSPLDAFAAQGRLLAKELNESRRRDRRMSRLPPYSVVRSLSQPRPGYFRSPGSGDSQQSLSRRPTQQSSPELEMPKYRPQSEYPRFSNVPTAESETGSIRDSVATPGRQSPLCHVQTDDEDIPKTESPVEDSAVRAASDEDHCPVVNAPVSGSVPEPSRQSSTDSVSHLNVPRALVPPASPRSRAAPADSSDDDISSSNGGSTFSQPRKLSSSSALSLPHAPMSPGANRSHRRSPSANSEMSTGCQPLLRPSLNFSRPLSRSSSNTPTSLPAPHSIPSGQGSAMSRTHKPSPIIVPSGFDFSSTSEEPSSTVSAYSNAQFPLPRGRGVSRDSVVCSDLGAPQPEGHEPYYDGSSLPNAAEEPGLPTPRSSSSSVRRDTDRAALNGQSSATDASSSSRGPNYSFELDRPERLSTDASKLSSVAARSDANAEEASSADSASTLRPQTSGATPAGLTGLTAEDHVTLGIECHEKGSLNESTYHLRLAAKMNDPTGMLLYALACRHGWGMRPNQQEGVRWLQKALDCVGVELLTDHANGSSGTSRAQEMVRKTHRAQFALSVYELGVSHLNGWGIKQDKALALRCFEIAAQWGDVDAMAEAGFCYVQGVGCKKDMKTAARYYRMAEANGMSMVGNSWIYKEKYMGDDEDTSHSRGRSATTSSHEKKNRGKSRTRSIFHRKKSFAAGA
ncbi:hypothetical protein MPDQ_004999 [Monascus purpureus]|uniref:Cell cycle inhibitor Nif1 n=1 Tax=Monascus purpureus TaxID=5098 RepID=A0A507R1U5_MONPU|nr:hypothetical protein MPDQ_004999 [Monascus purpureus]BDD54472.1 hypothetical protein MAP00_000089 [Monascus purpureus]